MADQPVPATAAPAAPAATPAAPAEPRPLTFERLERNLAGQFVSPGSPAAAPAPSKAEEKPPAVETPKPPEPPKAEEKPPEVPSRISQSVAMLARKERQLVMREQQLRQQLGQREAGLKDMESRLATQQAELQRQIDEMKDARGNPLKWLERGGFTYDALAQQMLNEGKVAPETLVQQTRADLEARLASERKELEGKIEAERKERERLVEEQKRQREENDRATIERFEREVLDFGTANASRFPLTVTLQQQAEVPKLIREYYQQTLEQDAEVAKQQGRQPIGKLLSNDEAYGLIEQHYRDLYQKAQQVMTQKPAEGTTPAPAAAAAAAPEQASQGERPTITNNLASNPSPPAPGEYLSEDERWRRALAAWDAAQAGGVRRP